VLSLSSRVARVACCAGCVVLFLAAGLWAQEGEPANQPNSEAPSSESSAEQPQADDDAQQPASDEPREPAGDGDEGAESSPSDAEPAEKAARAERKAAASRPARKVRPADLPDFDYTRLAHPSVAEQLELTDQQRAQVARIINQRATRLAAASPQERQTILQQANQELATLLTPEQLVELTSLSGDQSLRFNFRGQPWADVLDWFARQADLSLVMDKSPSGAFTYTNNRSYSPTEAIDLLNSVLLTKGFTLLQRGRMLILVDLSDDLPTNLIPRVPPDEIAEHGDFEIISVLFPLGGRPADQVVKEIQPLIGQYGSCVGLPQTGQLLVTETAGKMQAISILISSIPLPKRPEKKPEPEKKPDPPPPVLEIYPVTNTTPTAAVELLSMLFGGAKFTVDEETEKVMAYARPKEHEAIKRAIEQMEANRAPDNQPLLEVYSLELDEPEGLIEQLKAVMPTVQATYDPESERLMVFAPPKAQVKIKEMVRKIGGEMEITAKQVAVYHPKHFDPETLAEVVEQLAPRADVSADPRTRRVVVGASAAEQTMIKSLVEQLDEEAALEDQPVLQLYPLDKPLDDSIVDAIKSVAPEATVALSDDGRRLSVVARVVSQTIIKRMVEQWKEISAAQEDEQLKIYPLDRALSSEELNTIESLVRGADITLSTDSRQLKVIARPADHEQVELLIQQLGEAASAQPKPQLKVYPLEHALTSSDVSNLERLVPGADIVLSSDARQLRVTALADQHAELQEVIQQLDAAAAMEVQPELSVLPLSKPLSTTVLRTLESLVPQAELTVASDQKELIVVARPDDLAIIKKTLDQIAVSAGAAQDQQLEIYELDGLPAAELEKLIEPLAVQSSITLDNAQDRLIVWGPAEEHAAFANVIGKLQANPLVATRPTLQFYQLEDEDQFSQVSSALSTLVPSAKLTWDEPAQRAMVIATPKDQQKVRETIDQIQAEAGPSEDPVLRLYNLSPTQQTRFEVVREDVLEDLPGVRVIKDPQTGELAVWARTAQHEKFGEVLEQLEVSGEPGDKRLLIGYPITRGSAETVFEMLEGLFPSVKFSLDEKADRILAYAPLSEHGRIKQTIGQMDVEGTPSNQEELRSYSTGETSPRTLVTMLEELVPDMQLTPDTTTNKIIAWGTGRDHEALGKALEQMRREDPEDQPVIKAYSLPGREVRALLYMRSVLLEVVPDAAITIDVPPGNTQHVILVRRKPGDFVLQRVVVKGHCLQGDGLSAVRVRLPVELRNRHFLARYTLVRATVHIGHSTETVRADTLNLVHAFLHGLLQLLRPLLDLLHLFLEFVLQAGGFDPGHGIPKQIGVHVTCLFAQLQNSRSGFARNCFVCKHRHNFPQQLRGWGRVRCGRQQQSLFGHSLDMWTDLAKHCGRV